MSASVRYTIDLAEIDRAFAEARRRAGSLRGLHGAIGEVLLGAVRRNFETSGDGKWAPLKPATLNAVTAAAHLLMRVDASPTEAWLLCAAIAPHPDPAIRQVTEAFAADAARTEWLRRRAAARPAPPPPASSSPAAAGRSGGGVAGGSGAAL